MATKVTNVRVKDGKLVRVHKLTVSKKIGARKKAERLEKAWTEKSHQPKSTTTDASSKSMRRSKTRSS